jgi:hypothetical protein
MPLRLFIYNGFIEQRELLNYVCTGIAPEIKQPVLNLTPWLGKHDPSQP